jgi:hypothetical protein
MTDTIDKGQMTKLNKYTSEFKREAVRLMESPEKPSSQIVRCGFLALSFTHSSRTLKTAIASDQRRPFRNSEARIFRVHFLETTGTERSG